jgi:hypothetical protein
MKKSNENINIITHCLWIILGINISLDYPQIELVTESWPLLQKILNSKDPSLYSSVFNLIGNYASLKE